MGGAQGYELLRKSDEERIAPGADTLKELIAGRPTLFLLDELAVYLRKANDYYNLVTRAARQLTAFLTALFKAVESSPRTALVYTLAIGKNDGKGMDAYRPENEAIAQMMQEAESISARKATLLDPTEEDETVKILRRRLFALIDGDGAREIVDAYARLWEANREYLPPFGAKDTSVQDFREGFPLHPELVATLKEKTSTIGNFQRVRGMLRLLARTVARLWQTSPRDTYAIHLHHIDLRYSPIRQEFVTKLEQKAFVPALKADIAASEGDAPSLAERLDAEQFRGMAPYASYVARTIFLHTLAFNDSLKGAGEPELRYAILGPGLDIGFIDSAIRQFRQDSAFLDERPNSPLRFLAEPNLNQLVHQKEREIAPQDVRARLNDKIREIFKGAVFELVAFPAMASEIADNADRPKLVVIGYEAAAIPLNWKEDDIPELVLRLFKEASGGGPARINRNNLVFVVADENRIEDMKSQMRRRIALEDMNNNVSLQKDLAPHQVGQLKERYEKSKAELAVAIQQTYRHLFYPQKSAAFSNTARIDLAHAAIELPSTSEKPGVGQHQVIRILQDLNKFRPSDGAADSVVYMCVNTPLKNGSISTLDLRNEYRRNTKLSILQDDKILLEAIRNGIADGELVYQSGDLVCGKGDPYPHIEFSDKALVWTRAKAAEKKIWPRPKPKTDPGSSLPPTKQGSAPSTGSAAPVGGQPGIQPDPATPCEQEFAAEGPINEALTIIWEQAERHKCTTLLSMQIECDQCEDGFKIIALSSLIKDCDKSVSLEASFEMASASHYSISFNGSLPDSKNLQQFLTPLLRAALRENVFFAAVVLLDFTKHGFVLNKANKDALTARLTQAGAASAFVKITAKQA